MWSAAPQGATPAQATAGFSDPTAHRYRLLWQWLLIQSLGPVARG